MAAKKKSSGGGRKKAPAKRPPAKKAPAKKASGKASKKAIKKAGKRSAKRAKATKAKARGPRLTAAAQSIRDTLIVARKHQEWPWEAIAKEAGISVSATKKAYYSRRAASENLLEQDPIEIIRMLVEGLQLSIGDLEQLAVAGMEERNLAVAVGAKKGANDARGKLQDLLQSVGVLPHELGTLRWHVEFRSVVVQLVDTVDGFVKTIEGLKLPKAKRDEVVAAAVAVRDDLEGMGTVPDLNGGDANGN
jgi:hypothetical protein